MVLYLANDLKILWEQNSVYEARLWHQTSRSAKEGTVLGEEGEEEEREGSVSMVGVRVDCF